MNNMVIQLLGLAGMMLGIGCFQCKSSQSLLFMQVAINSMFIFHYFLLGAYGGCFSSLIFITGWEVHPISIWTGSISSGTFPL